MATPWFRIRSILPRVMRINLPYRWLITIQFQLLLRLSMISDSTRKASTNLIPVKVAQQMSTTLFWPLVTVLAKR